MELSVCMIVRDEESVIERCIKCIRQFADEIIIVDTGSKDKTKEIALAYTDKVYDFKWEDDFAKARNFSLSKACKEYVMWVDADDVIDEENIKKIIELKSSLNPKTDLIMMKYNTGFDDHGNPVFSFYRERIFKNNEQYRFEGAIHETVPLIGKIRYSDIEINHKKLKVNDPQRNLKIFRKIISKGKQLAPREQYYYARELYYNKFYFNAITVFKQFLLENSTNINDKIEACMLSGDCYLKLSDEEDALKMYYKSFSYDTPRGEVCCRIADTFLQNKKYQMAVFWYKTAMECPKNQGNGFIQKDYYDFIPLIQLCVCYDCLGDAKKAEEYNSLAGKIKPYDKSYIYNKKYFEKIKERRSNP